MCHSKDVKDRPIIRFKFSLKQGKPICSVNLKCAALHLAWITTACAEDVRTLTRHPKLLRTVTRHMLPPKCETNTKKQVPV